MKLRHLAFPLSLIASGSAYAQSSVTLYGVVDANIEFTTNRSQSNPPATPANPFPGPAKNAWQMRSGGLSASRWGLRGDESLGNGYKALFWLESGFNLDTGTSTQGGRLFGRQAIVGIQSDKFGQITFGRQFTAMFEMLANFSSTKYAIQYEPVFALLGSAFLEDNVAKYKGTFGPVTVASHWTFGNGLTGAGEVPGQSRRDTGYGAGLAYFSSPIGATIVYDQINPSQLAANGSFNGVGTNKKAAVAARYAFAHADIVAGYRWGQNKAADGTTILLRDDFYWVGGSYRLGPAFEFTLTYYYDNLKNFSGNKHLPNPWQVSFQADYRLSKRTDLYVVTAYAKNAGINMESSAFGFISGYSLGRGKNSMIGAAMGIRHKF
ncbi:porin [Cupriavidus sp. AcVe19-1a]|uniref:porin n=1 Tax=Cupriavidus sp. AcVe19-1a TaxID=2821359 RepID=UPI001AE9EBC8|nr:porin [Cupriavidus sp. AcVe19-1a]MBP0630523.1 porin [Cupriavidus sp. AcVe19-1a]